MNQADKSKGEQPKASLLFLEGSGQGFQLLQVKTVSALENILQILYLTVLREQPARPSRYRHMGLCLSLST